MAKEKLFTDGQVTANVAARVKRLLAEKGWTQKQLAAATGASLMRVNDLVHCRVSPWAAFVVRIAQVLGVTTDYLTGLEPEEKKSSRAS